MFRVNPEEIQEVYNTVVEMEQVMKGNKSIDMEKMLEVDTFISLQDQNHKPIITTTSGQNLVPGPKQSKLKQRRDDGDVAMKNYRNVNEFAKSEVDLLKLKKSAMIRMKQTISDKVLLHKLWETVSSEPFLTLAWATNLYPTHKLISTSKSVADIQSRGHLGSTPLYVSYAQSQKNIPTTNQNQSSDLNLLLKHERLLKTYGNVYSTGRR